GKGGGTLEQLARAKVVAFDKTGTLTHGEPTVVHVRPTGGLSESELLRLVASAEQYSSHVLAASIVSTARERGLELGSATDAREEATNGVTATIDGRLVVVGKRAFIEQNAGRTVSTPLESGQLGVYVAVDGKVAGAIVLSDS